MHSTSCLVTHISKSLNNKSLAITHSKPSVYCKGHIFAIVSTITHNKPSVYCKRHISAIVSTITHNKQTVYCKRHIFAKVSITTRTNCPTILMVTHMLESQRVHTYFE